MKKYVAIIATIMVCLVSLGQNRSDLLRQMNEIKSKDDVYFWNQYTHPNSDTARVNSIKWLLLVINSDRTGSDEFSEAEVTHAIRHIKINRGNLTQYFVYVKKSDISKAPQSAKESPTASQTSSPVAIESGGLNQMISREFVPDAFIQKMMREKDFYSVYRFLKSEKAQGEILQFGALKEIEDYSSLELILFDMQSKEIIAILSPVVQGTTRVNYMTGLQDSLENYPEDMLFVIWYIK